MKQALLLGLGVSGRAAAELLLAKGYQVLGVDAQADILSSQEEIKNLKRRGLTVKNKYDEKKIEDFDLIVVSPGISPSHPLYRAAIEKDIPLIGEAELALKGISQKAAVITGTNGKTTVTLLTEHILNASGFKARALGNVGNPFSSYVLNSNSDEIIVAEMSSYQLETFQSRVFDVGVILNITPDHLDRYASMQEYASAKCLLKNVIKNEKSLYVQETASKEWNCFLQGSSFKTFGTVPSSYLWTDRKEVFCQNHSLFRLSHYFQTLGEHESENVLAAWAIAQEFGVTDVQFLKALETFKKPPHRIEFVEAIAGVSYIDDSKGTNLDAVIQAVKTMPGAVILIAGGVDKGSSYKLWIEHFLGKVKEIIVLGQAAEKICNELKEFFNVHFVGSLKEAVVLASLLAIRGDYVLLSPGCSSFDMFRDYAHRGEEFKRYVKSLKLSSKEENHL
ncbi:MAG: UDP-N-acetylmuramoyl-L-alanine--D-glutamate ligase [Anaerolineae bacterium]